MLFRSIKEEFYVKWFDLLRDGSREYDQHKHTSGLGFDEVISGAGVDGKVQAGSMTNILSKSRFSFMAKGLKMTKSNG